MSYETRVIADSVNPAGVRLTSVIINLPRFILAQLNTHRVLSKSTASSRAMPVNKVRDMVMIEPYTPFYWGRNQRGMQAEAELSPEDQKRAERVWLRLRDEMVKGSVELQDIGVHKQITNRLLEPWLFTSVLVTATDWKNLFSLRLHHAAQPEFQRVVQNLKQAMDKSTALPLMPGEWHRPFAQPEDLEFAKSAVCPTASKGLVDPVLNQLCIARCARLSYMTHDGKRDPAQDLRLFHDLERDRHIGPMEHVAMAIPTKDRIGNFRGWIQYRKTMKGESGED